ncbi:site-specific DNA-methyltransferase [Candidatus Uhrbacteria bacterium]|nr:site-specific DNA-methyltransferase [Candidatus Uhrbacteria bacterium]
MEKSMTNNIKKVKDDLVAEIDKRIADKIIEKTNADLLKKLIEQAETINEAIMIAELGTTYKRTGFHFDKRLEKMTDTIKFFKKNEKLSFVQDKNALTHKLIIGDNYDALHNLLIEYRGKIDVIYIDPPYGKDSMGEFAETNYENAITRDNLLSMLYPRLVLAHQLLSDNGVIFCSIDDKNQAYVKGLFDEVFGESKGETYIWCLQDKSETSFVKTASKTVRKEHEYILAYFMGEKSFGKYASKRNFEIESDFSNPDNDPRGGWFSGNMSRNGIKSTTGSKYYTITTPTGKTYTRNWTLSKEEYEEAIKNNDIYFSKNGDGVPRLKIFPNSNNWLIQSSLFTDVHTAITGRKMVVDILGDEVFDFPKPVDLIYRLLELYQDNNAVVLDFFMGSGTTGQAVLELNQNDEGARIFIGVQLDENLDNSLLVIADNKKEESTIKKQINLCDKLKRPHLLSEITVERLRRIMLGKTLNGDKDFKWIENNKTLGDNLDVYDIATVAPYSDEPFKQIDETLYGKEKLGVNEKIKWVCENFESTTKTLEGK